MSRNLVIEITLMLTCSQVGTQIALPRDKSLKLTICLSTHLATQQPSPYLRPYSISIWELTRDASCWGKSLPVQQAVHSELALYWSLCQVQEVV